MGRITTHLGNYYRGSSWARTVGLGFLCVGVLSGYAFAQASTSGSQPEATVKSKDRAGSEEKAKVESEVEAKAKAKAAARAKAKAKAKHEIGPRAVKGKRRPQFKMDPNAKWVCDKPSVTLEPVWRTDVSMKLTFDFEIRSAGTADLKINARGG